jgi:hypothetical protein
LERGGINLAFQRLQRHLLISSCNPCRFLKKNNSLCYFQPFYFGDLKQENNPTTLSVPLNAC